jgi:selenocysteine lyase/cysteine desulfurase
MLTPTLPRALPAVDPLFGELRAREFSRLDRAGHAYLDYTGSALYAECQIRAVHEALLGGVFGNPHSESEPSRASASALEEARSLLLAHLDADPSEYVVCFTANTTAAIKLVAESYPFGSNGGLALASDNHNSVNGVREYARRAGAVVTYLPLDDELRLTNAREHLARARASTSGAMLFAFPAQSNFSGVRHPLSLVTEARRLGYDVLLDAAAFLPSKALSLSQVSPDFVALSFYKLFGYPTGLGALVVKRRALDRLERPWFAGGTVFVVSVRNAVHALRPEAAGFEDGTPDFLAGVAVRDGLAFLGRVGMDRLSAHVRRLTSQLLAALRSLSHRDGAPLVRLYGPRGMQDRGGIVTFNVLDARGAVVPYELVEQRARAAGVSLRTGCFCNPGASEAALGLDADVVGRCFRAANAGGDGFDDDRFFTCLREARPGNAVGAVRYSLGMANNDADVERAVDVVASFVD